MHLAVNINNYFNPLLASIISNFADALGVLVPIPTLFCEFDIKYEQKSKNRR